MSINISKQKRDAARASLFLAYPLLIPNNFFPFSGPVPQEKQNASDTLIGAHRKTRCLQSETQHPDSDDGTQNPNAPHGCGDDDKGPLGVARAAQRTSQHLRQHLRDLNKRVVLQADGAQSNYRQIRRKHPQNWACKYV